MICHRAALLALALDACGRVRAIDMSPDANARRCLSCADASSRDAGSGVVPDGSSSDGATTDGALTDAGPSPFGGDAAWDGNTSSDAASDGYTVLVTEAGVDPIRVSEEGEDIGLTTALDPANVYWMTSQASVWSVPKVGGSVTQWALYAAWPNTAFDPTLAVSGSTLFYAFSESRVYVQPLSLSQPVDTWIPEGALTSVAVGPSGVFTTGVTSTVAVEPTSSEVLARVRPDGGLPETVATFSPVPGDFRSAPLLIDAAYAYLAPVQPRVIVRVPLGGGVIDTLAIDVWPLAFVQDETSLYWMDCGTTAVESMPKGGGTPTTLVGFGLFEDDADDVALAVDSDWVYFTVGSAGYPPGYLARVPKAGGAVVTLAQGVNPRGVAVDDVAIYWLDDPPKAVSRLMKSGL